MQSFSRLRPTYRRFAGFLPPGRVIFAPFWALTLFPITLQAQPAPQVLTVQAKLSPSAAGADTLNVSLRINKPFHINANPASNGLLPTVVSLQAAPGASFGKPVYPAGQARTFRFTTKPIKVYQGQVNIRVPVKMTGRVPQLRGSVRFQACNENSCLMPQTVAFQVASAGKSPPKEAAKPVAATQDATVAASALRKRFKVQGLPTIVFIDKNGHERQDLRLFGAKAEELTRAQMIGYLSALRGNATVETKTGRFDNLGRLPLWAQLSLVFLGGLLLNLTPCVYPMIPITVGYFGVQSEGQLGKTFSLALLYVLGLAIVYSALGVTAALTGTLFGSALQSRWVVGFVALVLGALSLSMMGLFTLQPPSFLMARGGAKKGGWGALGMGALLGVVAAPCVGPVVAALLTYVGFKHDPLLGFALFFSLSLGLGLPYLLLGAFSGSIKSLPRSGAWLEKSKKVFAVPLLIAAIFYGYSAIKPSAAAEATHGWTNASARALNSAKAAGQPAVIDFRADWCLPCVKLEKQVFSRPEVLKASKGVSLLRADLTRE